MIIFIGRLFYLCVWAFLIFNLICPLPHPANIVGNIALLVLILTHGLQAILLNATLTPQEKQNDRFKVFRLFVFGIFETLNWNQTKNKR